VQRARKRYRQLVASLNREIATVEIRMSEGEWGAIAPHALPAACLRKKQAALLNRPSTRGALLRASKSGPGGYEVREAGADADRVACATRMLAHLVAGGAVHGRTVNVHSLVDDCMGKAAPDLVAEAQWADVRAMFEEMAADPLRPCKLGKYVALADVSGSMHGDPMSVAIGLGILISEVSHPAFRDRFMTFESTPRWHSLAGAASLHAKVHSAARAPWGGSTDFGAAMDLLLETCVAAQLGPDDVPEALVVISDMQFDVARGACSYYGYGGGSAPPAARAWVSEQMRITAAWRKAGYAAAPTIVFWNVRGDTRSFPAAADTPGVEMVSGFSQNLLKLFMEGEGEEEEEEEAEAEAEAGAEAEAEAVLEGGGAAVPPAAPKAKKKKTPLDTMRRALDSDRYAVVREVCQRVLAEPESAPAVARASEAAECDGVLWAAVEAAAADARLGAAGAAAAAVVAPVLVVHVPAATAAALVGRGGRSLRAIETSVSPPVCISVPHAIGGADTVEVRVAIAVEAAAAAGAEPAACEASVRAAAEAVAVRVREVQPAAQVRCVELKGSRKK